MQNKNRKITSFRFQSSKHYKSLRRGVIARAAIKKACGKTDEESTNEYPTRQSKSLADNTNGNKIHRPSRAELEIAKLPSPTRSKQFYDDITISMKDISLLRQLVLWYLENSIYTTDIS